MKEITLTNKLGVPIKQVFVLLSDVAREHPTVLLVDGLVFLRGTKPLTYIQTEAMAITNVNIDRSKLTQ